jgi:hypothetical protein
MHSIARHPAVRRPMSLRRRRALVVATYVGFAAFMVTLYAGSTAVPRWPVWLGCSAIVLFAATAAVFGALVRAPGYAADGSTPGSTSASGRCAITRIGSPTTR